MNPKLVLDLLDDQPPLKTATLDWNPPPAPKIAASPATSKGSQQKGGPQAGSPSTAAPSGLSRPSGALGQTQKVFRQTRSLRDLMSEYNTRPPAHSRSSVRTGGPSAPSRREFSSDRVEHIQLAEIPGKILRPA